MLGTSTAFGRQPTTSVIDQNPTHGFTGSTEEIGTVFPGFLLIASQPKPRFMDQRRRLPGVPLPLGSHAGCRLLTKFVVDSGSQIGSDLRIPRIDGIEQESDVAQHGSKNKNSF
jgi:hypothetical protein